MKVAVLGGTGKLGLALALRLHWSGNDVMIGSRDAAKAVESANSLNGNIIGASNAHAAAWCNTAVVSVPYSAHRAVLEQVKEDLRGKVIIDATVPLDPINLLQIRTESGKSAAEETLEMIPEAAVFAALQTISFRVLRQRDDSHDVLVAGGTQGKSGVMDLMRSMKLRPIDAGPLEVAGHIERLTALLLSINKANRVKESGISITGL